MPLGPVFNAELLTTARRARFYVLRLIYGLIVLFQIYVVYQSNTWMLRNGRAELTIREMANFALSIFTSFAVVQAIVVLLLTPALVGGTIADERQRKTLHYLLTSRLGGGEIVVGKLAARLLQLGVFLAMGLPVVSLISLFGGVDPALIALTYGGTITSMYFLATLSILTSVHSRLPREAIMSLYVIGLTWLFLPTFLLAILPRLYPMWWAAFGQWIEPVLVWAAVCSPAYLLLSLPGMIGTNQLVGSALWVMGTQVVYGTILVAIAGLRLRPAFRRIEGGGRGRIAWLRGLNRKGRWLPRPPCGDDAMLWKERYASRTGRMTKAVSFLVGGVLLALLVYAGYDFVKPVVLDIWNNGWSDVNSYVRRDLNGFLRGVGVAIFVVWSLGVATASAGGVSGEREGDTWLSLTATPLSGREILRAKMLGAAWSIQALAYLQFCLWGLGLVLGAIHPFGVVAGLVELAVYTWFIAALGTLISLQSRNSTRALAATMATLIFVNGGYLFCCIPLRPGTTLMVVGCTPAILAGSLMTYAEAGQLLSSHRGMGQEAFATGVISVLGYGIAAMALTYHAFTSFDAVVGRPDRFSRTSPRPGPKPGPESAGGLE